MGGPTNSLVALALVGFPTPALADEDPISDRTAIVVPKSAKDFRVPPAKRRSSLP